jgi:hypothetical protein
MVACTVVASTIETATDAQAQWARKTGCSGIFEANLTGLSLRQAIDSAL